MLREYQSEIEELKKMIDSGGFQGGAVPSQVEKEEKYMWRKKEIRRKNIDIIGNTNMMKIFNCIGAVGS